MYIQSYLKCMQKYIFCPCAHKLDRCDSFYESYLQFSFDFILSHVKFKCRFCFMYVPCNEHQRQSSGIDSRLDTQRANGCFSSNGLQIFMEKQWLLVCIAALSKGHSLCSLYSNGLCFCNTVDWILCAKILAKRFSLSFFVHSSERVGRQRRRLFWGYCCSPSEETSYFIVEASLIFRLSGPPKSLENKRKFSVF